MTGVKRFFAWLWWIPILVVAAIVGEIPWIKRAGAWLDAHHDLGVAVTVGAAVAGFVLMMGGIIASVMAEDDSSGSGGGSQIETSFPAMKAAWRSGAWRRDPPWRRLFATALGAALLTIGLFGIFIVVAPWPVKVLCAGAILYPAVRLTMAFRKS